MFFQQLHTVINITATNPQQVLFTLTKLKEGKAPSAEKLQANLA